MNWILPQWIQISPEWITAFAAIAALVVAIIIAWKQIAIQNKQTCIAREQTEIARQQMKILEYQEQERQREMGKAELKAEFVERPEADLVPSYTPFRYILRIKNEGKARARDIEILINDNPAQEFFAFLNGLKADDIPRTLEGGLKWEQRMAFADGRERKFEIKIAWSDDSGEGRSFEQLLSPIKEP